MIDKKSNLCVILGLNPFKAFEPEKLDDIVANRRSKLRKYLNNPGKMTACDIQFFLDNMDVAKERIMDDTEREKAYSEAKVIFKANISPAYKKACITRNGVYPQKKFLNTILDNLDYDVEFEKACECLGIESGKIPYPVSSDVSAAFKSMKDLGVYHVEDLLNNLSEYVALPPGMDDGDPAYLRQIVNDALSRMGSKHISSFVLQDKYTDALRKISVVIDYDELGSLKAYGEAQERMAPILREIDLDFDGGRLEKKDIDDILDRNNIRENMYISILEMFCYEKKIPAIFTDSTIVRCGNCEGIALLSGDGMTCPICGGPVRMRCPKCKTLQPISSVCISCGMDFADTRRRESDLRDRFEIAMGTGSLDEAESILKEYTDISSDDSAIGSMTSALAEKKKLLRSFIDKAMDKYDNKLYCGCVEICEQAKTSGFPLFVENNKTVAAMYRNCTVNIDDATNLFAEGDSLGSEKESYELYMRAAKICPDHPMAGKKMAMYPPEGPGDIGCEVRSDSVVLTFAIPEERDGVTFCVFRSENGIDYPEEPIGMVTSSVFQDKEMDSAVDYHYRVYSKRFGVYSKEYASFGPVHILKEVSDLRLENIEGGFTVLFEEPENASNIRIYRKDNTPKGEGEEVSLVSEKEGMCTDNCLEGDSIYHYLVYVEYCIGGNTERTPGIMVTGRTSEDPEPATDLRIERSSKDGSYTATWKCDGEVKLYKTDRKLVSESRTVPLSGIDSVMTVIEPMETTKGSIKFKLDEGSLTYIYPMRITGGRAIRGQGMSVSNFPPVRNHKATVKGNVCHLTFTWPESAVAAEIRCSNEVIAPGQDMSGVEVMRITRDQYAVEEEVCINMGLRKHMHIGISAEYFADDEKKMSREVRVQAQIGTSKRIRYNIKRTRENVRIEISCDEKTELPSVCARYVDEGVPLKMDEGTLVWFSTEPITIDGKKTIITDMDEGVNVDRVRLFFMSEDSYGPYAIMHSTRRS